MRKVPSWGVPSSELAGKCSVDAAEFAAGDAGDLFQYRPAPSTADPGPGAGAAPSTGAIPGTGRGLREGAGIVRVLGVLRKTFGDWTSDFSNRNEHKPFTLFCLFFLNTEH